MEQRAAYATTLWTRIAAFSFVSSILYTAFFFEEVSGLQDWLLAAIGATLAVVFFLIIYGMIAYFSAVESGIKSAETELKELAFPFKSKIRAVPENTNKKACVCISSGILLCLGISNSLYPFVIAQQKRHSLQLVLRGI